VFSKEGGIYARYALMRMLELGYQVRAGILTAGHYGAPQVIVCGRGGGRGCLHNSCITGWGTTNGCGVRQGGEGRGGCFGRGSSELQGSKQHDS